MELIWAGMNLLHLICSNYFHTSNWSLDAAVATLGTCKSGFWTQFLNTQNQPVCSGFLYIAYLRPQTAFAASCSVGELLESGFTDKHFLAIRSTTRLNSVSNEGLILSKILTNRSVSGDVLKCLQFQNAFHFSQEVIAVPSQIRIVKPFTNKKCYRKPRKLNENKWNSSGMIMCLFACFLPWL